MLNSVLVELVWNEMLAMYGRKFVDMWSVTSFENVKNVWARRLSGLTRDELVRGLEACEKLDWPPTLPEFKNLCRPEKPAHSEMYEIYKAPLRLENNADKEKVNSIIKNLTDSLKIKEG